ncbi:MAG TPA: Stp1/IreP family PP2C-type Ser/Thr phosphatase [Thermoanaerobaculia bacterium]|nr:Stp1/IreP family PP2C-type Ser/Thr phosphatase [Thermoanaerobaculia bacterium]
MSRIKACGLSDVGLTRTHNEDCFDIDPDHHMYVVADGMGGHSHGEVASRIAVKAIRDFVAQTADGDTTWPFAYDTRLQRHSNRLKAAVRIAHDRVLRAIRQDGTLVGMGTTVVGFLIDDDTAAVAHVGDSRAYRLRDGHLDLLTQDHTWVNEQVVAGYLSEEQARAHPLKNVVTRALGGESEVVVDVKEFDLRPGDVYLLCSDGLTTMLSDEEIEKRLQASQPGDQICRSLVKDANSRGGLDNVTVVLLSVEATAEESD